ncbi:Hypothetical_protein [Hexamita inflata]|uniref:Hypothetical_protein n=1 Tax=Hexamita inflata TaxID=28002 RepID=A0AA86NGF6_9EUKA|nr:Hypothetical protein HINF_LOCUS6835 [Hexamita inflata]
MTIHKSKLSYTQRYHKLISTSYLIFSDCHSEQPPQTTQVSSALELTLLTSEVIFVTIFGMAGMNIGTSVSAATRSASKFRAGNNVITLQSVSSCSCSFTLESEISAIYQLHKICVCVLLFYIVSSIRTSSCITGSESRISFQFIQKLTYSLLSVLCGADTTYGINSCAGISGFRFGFYFLGFFDFGFTFSDFF